MGGFRRAMTWALLLGGSALCSPAVQAKGFYFGGSVGLSEARDLDFAPIADGSTLSGRTDGTDSGWKLYGGFKVMRFLNAELSYRDHGQAAFTAISDGTGTIYAMGPVEGLSDTTAFSVSAMVVLPAGRFTLFAKGGLARWRT
ncbi:MAG: hypothetical protein GTO33_03400, partial [Acidobacteria bacterium]|nr:hypothetical protein [Acidobacteriota bacterium]